MTKMLETIVWVFSFIKKILKYIHTCVYMNVLEIYKIA